MPPGRGRPCGAHHHPLPRVLALLPPLPPRCFAVQPNAAGTGRQRRTWLSGIHTRTELAPHTSWLDIKCLRYGLHQPGTPGRPDNAASLTSGVPPPSDVAFGLQPAATRACTIAGTASALRCQVTQCSAARPLSSLWCTSAPAATSACTAAAATAALLCHATQCCGHRRTEACLVVRNTHMHRTCTAYHLANSCWWQAKHGAKATRHPCPPDM